MLKKLFSRKFFIAIAGIAAAVFTDKGISPEVIYSLIAYIIGQSAVDIAEQIREPKKENK